LQVITQSDVEAKLRPFAKEIFVSNVTASPNAVTYSVNVNNPEWLLNDHFPGVSIIQCFFQGAMLMFYEHDRQFDPEVSLFFAGGIKVKFLKPIFEGYQVTFNLACERFMQNVLLFEGVCVNASGEAYAKASGSLSSKPRVEVVAQKS
jgi:3-hydroxymyristoyl/3-hydroxydecanoyl-(acyl carrier protein) dehydratase